MGKLSIPQITGIYDPVSGRSDGTITPLAPVVVSGCHLDMMYPLGEITLCLASAIDFIHVIEITCIYKRSDEQIIITLPYLKPGEYFPAVLMRSKDKDKEKSVYILPVSWIVQPYRCDNMSDYYKMASE